MGESRDRFPSIPGLQFIERLGSGAVGSVYLARDERLRKLVAVKVLRRELAGNRLYIERLRREANLSMRLSHPNIVKGLDLGEADGSLFFVMEFVDGKTLKTVLRERGRLEEEEVIEIGLQVARALDHAYRNGVVHRDIKPGNILVSPDGIFKLADLGLARRPDDSSVTRDGVTLGTPHYISPEQALDASRADVRSDLYSLGATLFHAATGRPPFEAETVAGVLSQVLEPTKIATIPDDVPVSRNLQLVLRRLLVKDPNRRYPSPDDLMRDLERVRRRERPQVSIFDVSPAAGRRVRAGLMAVVSVGLVVLLVWGGSKLAGGAGDSTMTQAEAQLSVKLTEIEKAAGSDPPGIAERYRRVASLLGISGLTPALRVRAVDLRSRIEEQLSASLGSLERSCEQDLTLALAEGRFGDASDLLAHAFPPRFDALFGGGYDGLPEMLTTRVRQFFVKKDEELTGSIDKAEEALAGEVPIYLTSLESQVAGLQEGGRYKSALEALDIAVGKLEIEGGPSWRKLPAASRERLAERMNPKIGELRAATLTAAREAARRISQRLQREHDRLEESLRSGVVASAASEFEDLAVETFEETHFRQDEWPPQVSPDPAKLRGDLGSSLRNLEKERARAEAESAFVELDEKLATRLRERQYLTARNEWQSRLDRSSFAPIHDRMARRLRYCEKLVDLRERARQWFVKQVGKRVSLTLRSGAAVAGKLATAEAAEDDFILTFQEGNAGAAWFSVLSSSDIEKAAEFSDTAGDRYLRGVFWLAEGQSDRARADFSAVRARSAEDPELLSSATAALLDADALRFTAGGVNSVRDGRFEEAKRKARAFAAIGEVDLAREWYGNARREADGFVKGDNRLTELESEMQQFEAAARDQKRMKELDRAFPGARARELGEGRIELLYEFNEKVKVAGLELGEAWRLTPAGLEFDARAAVVDIVKSPTVKLVLGSSVRAPARAVARISVPADAKESADPVRAVLMFGKTVVFAGGRARQSHLTMVRGSGLDGLESELRAAAVGPQKPNLGLLRGGTHSIEFAIDADGRAYVVTLDGYVIARGEGATLTDVFEMRSNSPIVWHSLLVEGRLTPKR